MPRKKSATKKPKEPKFTPVQRVCAYAPCSKPFMAKREKEYFHAAKCRQAQFAHQRKVKTAAECLSIYKADLLSALASCLDAPHVFDTEASAIAFAAERTHEVYRLTNALAMSVPQTVLQHWMVGMTRLNGITDRLRLNSLSSLELIDIAKVITGLYQQMLQFSQNHAPGHCPQCGGTVNDPELLWRNEQRCANEWHRTERLMLDAKAGS